MFHSCACLARNIGAPLLTRKTRRLSTFGSFYRRLHSNNIYGRWGSSDPKMGSICALEQLNLQYPSARRDESVVDDYHGVRVSDPYRWLEDPDADEVREFVDKQADLTESLLRTCDTRDKLREQITKLFDHPRFDTPFKQGNKFFYFHNTGLQAQDVLYVQDSLDGPAEVLLDPNGLSEDGTVALNTFSVSEDARYLAYGLSSSGSDWVTIKVMRVEDKSVEPDTLTWVKFSSISWTHDSKGLFYSRYPAPKDGEHLDAGTETNANFNHEVYYHFLGTDQCEDILCWRDPNNPKYTFGAEVTEDGNVRGCLLQILTGFVSLFLFVLSLHGGAPVVRYSSFSLLY